MESIIQDLTNKLAAANETIKELESVVANCENQNYLLEKDLTLLENKIEKLQLDKIRLDLLEKYHAILSYIYSSNVPMIDSIKWKLTAWVDDRPQHIHGINLRDVCDQLLKLK